jgi:hypothetical protein
LHKQALHSVERDVYFKKKKQSVTAKNEFPDDTIYKRKYDKKAYALTKWNKSKRFFRKESSRKKRKREKKEKKRMEERAIKKKYRKAVDNIGLKNIKLDEMDSILGTDTSQDLLDQYVKAEKYNNNINFIHLYEEKREDLFSIFRQRYLLDLFKFTKPRRKFSKQRRVSINILKDIFIRDLLLPIMIKFDKEIKNEKKKIDDIRSFSLHFYKLALFSADKQEMANAVQTRNVHRQLVEKELINKIKQYNHNLNEVESITSEKFKKQLQLRLKLKGGYNNNNNNKNFLNTNNKVFLNNIYKLINNKNNEISKKKKYIHDSRSLHSEYLTNKEENQNLISFLIPILINHKRRKLKRYLYRFKKYNNERKGIPILMKHHKFATTHLDEPTADLTSYLTKRDNYRTQFKKKFKNINDRIMKQSIAGYSNSSDYDPTYKEFRKKLYSKIKRKQDQGIRLKLKKKKKKERVKELKYIKMPKLSSSRKQFFDQINKFKKINQEKRFRNNYYIQNLIIKKILFSPYYFETYLFPKNLDFFLHKQTQGLRLLSDEYLKKKIIKINKEKFAKFYDFKFRFGSNNFKILRKKIKNRYDHLRNIIKELPAVTSLSENIIFDIEKKRNWLHFERMLNLKKKNRSLYRNHLFNYTLRTQLILPKFFRRMYNFFLISFSTNLKNRFKKHRHYLKYRTITHFANRKLTKNSFNMYERDRASRRKSIKNVAPSLSYVDAILDHSNTSEDGEEEEDEGIAESDYDFRFLSRNKEKFWDSYLDDDDKKKTHKEEIGYTSFDTILRREYTPRELTEEKKKYVFDGIVYYSKNLFKLTDKITNDSFIPDSIENQRKFRHNEYKFKNKLSQLKNIKARKLTLNRWTQRELAPSNTIFVSKGAHKAYILSTLGKRKFNIYSELKKIPIFHNIYTNLSLFKHDEDIKYLHNTIKTKVLPKSSFKCRSFYVPMKKYERERGKNCVTYGNILSRKNIRRRYE